MFYIYLYIKCNRYKVKFKSVILLTFLFGLMLVGCKPRAYIVEEDNRQYTAEDVFEKIVLNYHEVIDTYTGRARLKIVEGEKESNLRGLIRIKKDSAVMVSLIAFAGIEAARILFTSDSLKIIDRINKNYFYGEYARSIGSVAIPLDLDIVQGIFLSNPGKYLPYPDVYFNDRERYFFNNGFIILSARRHFSDVSSDKVSAVETRTKIDRNFLIRQIDLLFTEDDLFISLKFNSFMNIENRNLPSLIELTFVSDQFEIYAEMDLRRVEINQDLSFPFNVPEGFDRIQKIY